VSWLRRVLIEMWGMVVFAALIGFLGPFGTYGQAEFPGRVWHWWMLLMGAYVLVRPSLLLWAAIADVTSLPRRMLISWGVLLSSFPLALLWEWSASVFFHALGGFGGLLPFAMLSAVGVLLVTMWARSADDHLRESFSTARPDDGLAPSVAVDQAQFALADGMEAANASSSNAASPRLAGRLPKGFRGPIIALQAEDHYVRVHGTAGSELLLMRLRDAVAEMDDCPGSQVHRSWWVAAGGIASIDMEGRNRTIHLVNGETAPVARESVRDLERAGFLQYRDGVA